eukprot:TRINITY_DN2067_c0_g1_i1.p1 TRINITY_DN2067_c0_g1~~TRINITY_DN2067_c0_g1_i1.p1  ORF type:complete len:323 (+),score=107.56 TRINITY_DN2067_c0_g1_i1:71-1039(+)
MKGPMYVERNLGAEKHKEMMHKAHKLTLEKISKLKKSQFLPQEDMWYDKIHESMLRTHQFCQTMKEAAIQRYNNKVLGQLTEISGGRFSTLKKLLNASLTCKSLNYCARRREEERIERENLAFAKRLLQKQSAFNKKEMDDHFEKHKKYRSQILKVQSITMKKAKLPPLQAKEGASPFKTINEKQKEIETAEDNKPEGEKISEPKVQPSEKTETKGEALSKVRVDEKAQTDPKQEIAKDNPKGDAAPILSPQKMEPKNESKHDIKPSEVVEAKKEEEKKTIEPTQGEVKKIEIKEEEKQVALHEKASEITDNYEFQAKRKNQ